MKKLILRLLLVSFLATNMTVFAQDHDAVTDSATVIEKTFAFDMAPFNR